MQHKDFLCNFAPVNSIYSFQKWGQHLKFCKKIMTQQEFFERTMVEVSTVEYSSIESMYYYSDLDKDEFCKMWCKMNKTRVQNARIEHRQKMKEQCYKDSLRKWFEKYRGTQFFFDNYHTNIAYIKLSVYLVQAMSFAGIRLDRGDSFSDVHFKVGKYLGIYRSL